MISEHMGIFDLRDWWMSNPEFANVFGLEALDPGPFYPFSEPSEVSPPMIVYQSQKYVKADKWWMHYEKVYLRIISFNVDDIFKITNVMIDMAGKGAISARDMESWIKSQKRPEYNEYHCIEYVGGRDDTPPKERGGAYEYEIGFLIDYSPRKGSYIKDLD